MHLGNSLIPHDRHSKEPGDQWPESNWHFDFMLSNPPFGVTWGGKDGYETEARKLEKSRYRAGMPRVNDGALLFLQTMLAKMKEPAQGGSRIAIIFNGSPLSNGDCGPGEYCDGASGDCTPDCTDGQANPCAAGDVCDDASGDCVPAPTGCTDNADCQAPLPVCDTARGDCVER